DRFWRRVVRLRRAANVHRPGSWLVVEDHADRGAVRKARGPGTLAGAFASGSRWRTRFPQTAARRLRARNPRAIGGARIALGGCNRVTRPDARRSSKSTRR